MSTAVPSLGVSLRETLCALSRRPWLLVALLLFLNAVLLPYRGIVHDSQIYSGLVLNRIDPEFLRDDLFFKYGSQDKFSAFSPMMVPLVQLLGLKTAFFLAYIVSLTLFFAALVRFVTHLWPDSPGAVVGLIFLSFVQVAYGGFVPLHVIEPFLSARTPACALTLWGASEFLDRRPWRASLFLAASFAIHPLMTLPGIMLVGIVAIARQWGARGVAITGAVSMTVFGGILAYPPLAFQLFGHFDDKWLELTQVTNCYQFPQEWSADQWFRNLFAMGLLGAAAWWTRSAVGLTGPDQRPGCSAKDRAHVLAAVAIIGFAGFFGCWLFTQTPYALLHKGQAYRWIWLPMAIMPPALLDFAWRAWQTNRLPSRLFALTIVAFLGTTTFEPLEFAAYFFMTPVVFYGFMIFAKEWPWTEKLSATLLISFVFGFAVWGSYRTWIFFALCSDLVETISPVVQYQSLCVMLGSSVVLPLILLAIAGFNRRLVSTASLIRLAGAALAFQIGMYAWSRTDHYKAQDPLADENRFVEKFLNERRGNQPHPVSIYCNHGSLGTYWVEWRTRSYYDCFQLAGFVFNRDTAVEGKRRAALVAPFEAANLTNTTWDILPKMIKDKVEGWFEIPIDEGHPPSDCDLMRLARDESVDYIILFKTHFDELACARRGDVSIYDCRQLRGLPSHDEQGVVSQLKVR